MQTAQESNETCGGRLQSFCRGRCLLTIRQSNDYANIACYQDHFKRVLERHSKLDDIFECGCKGYDCSGKCERIHWCEALRRSWKVVNESEPVQRSYRDLDTMLTRGASVDDSTARPAMQ